MSLFPKDLEREAMALLQVCRKHGLTVATAESCTGGLVAGCLTAIAGSSDVIDRGFVSYTNEAKQEMLGVPVQLLESHGAVSEQVARAMAVGAVDRAQTDVAVAVTGIAGPGGATPNKPVGLVYFAAARCCGETISEYHVLPGDRTDVRVASVRIAISLLRRIADQS
ncbi:MAG: CinA family protein [Rhodospirillales bacterium]|jgi:nicotinamide-nucleotide amidase